VSVKFFGQFLIERDEIDPGQLQEALAMIKAESRTLGEIAIQLAFFSRADATRVNRQQRVDDRPFGELAVEMGLLTPQQLQHALAVKEQTHLYLGEALVRLGHLPVGRLGGLLDEFKIDQAPYEQGPVAILPGELSGNRLARAVVDLIPKLCRRVASLPAKVSLGEPLEEVPDLRYRVSVSMRSVSALEVALSGDRDFALTLAAATAGLAPESLDENLVEDGLAEFLQVVAGNALTVVACEGVRSHLSPPDLGVLPADGYAFEIITTRGSGILIMAPILAPLPV
jgi:hypothetical protein